MHGIDAWQDLPIDPAEWSILADLAARYGIPPPSTPQTAAALVNQALLDDRRTISSRKRGRPLGSRKSADQTHSSDRLTISRARSLAAESGKSIYAEVSAAVRWAMSTKGSDDRWILSPSQDPKMHRRRIIRAIMREYRDDPSWLRSFRDRIAQNILTPT